MPKKKKVDDEMKKPEETPEEIELKALHTLYDELLKRGINRIGQLEEKIAQLQK
jgi:hypothetical protein